MYQIIGSAILELEMNRMHDVAKMQRVKDLYKVKDVHVAYTEAIKERSQEIMKQSNIRAFDSLHIAAAEADVMLTTDDGLEKWQQGWN